jgi:hypothetical protein
MPIWFFLNSRNPQDYHPSALSRRNLRVAMGERHGASRRWGAQPAASAVPLTTRIFRLDNALVYSDISCWLVRFSR